MLASSTAVRPMNIATRSVSMWPASASSAIELIHSAVTSSMTKNAVRIAAAMTIRLTRVIPPCRDRVQHPYPQSMRKHAYVARARSEPGRPEPRQVDRHRSQPPFTPDRSKNQPPPQKNYWLSGGTISSEQQDRRNPTAWRAPARAGSPGSGAAPARRSRPGPESAAGSAARAVTCRNPRNATPAQNTRCAGS